MCNVHLCYYMYNSTYVMFNFILLILSTILSILCFFYDIMLLMLTTIQSICFCCHLKNIGIKNRLFCQLFILKLISVHLSDIVHSQGKVCSFTRNFIHSLEKIYYKFI